LIFDILFRNLPENFDVIYAKKLCHLTQISPVWMHIPPKCSMLGLYLKRGSSEKLKENVKLNLFDYFILCKKNNSGICMVTSISLIPGTYIIARFSFITGARILSLKLNIQNSRNKICQWMFEVNCLHFILLERCFKMLKARFWNKIEIQNHYIFLKTVLQVLMEKHRCCYIFVENFLFVNCGKYFYSNK